MIVGTTQEILILEGIFRCPLELSQNYRTMDIETLWEKDQGGYLCHDECDGQIITVGH